MAVPSNQSLCPVQAYPALRRMRRSSISLSGLLEQYETKPSLNGRSIPSHTTNRSGTKVSYQMKRCNSLGETMAFGYASSSVVRVQEGKYSCRRTSFVANLLTHLSLEIQSLCYNDHSAQNLVPLRKRKMVAFYKRFQPSQCSEFLELNADGFYHVELISSLILQGKMNTVLRIISSPFVDFGNWRRNPRCNRAC